MAAGSRGCMTALISVANLIIIILAIVIMCLSVNHWNDYTSASLTILVALCWACCVCVENNVALSCYSVLMTVDMLILLANAIYYSVIVKRYSTFCDDMARTDLSGPEWGCHGWRRTDKAYTIGILVCFYIAFALRLFNIIGSCLLARSIYQAV